MEKFGNTETVPVYYVMFTVLVIVASTIMFKEHQTPTEIAAQFSGFVTIVGGTFILHSTKDMDLTGSLAGFNAKGQGPVANIRGTEELPILAGRETKQDL